MRPSRLLNRYYGSLIIDTAHRDHEAPLLPGMINAILELWPYTKTLLPLIRRYTNWLHYYRTRPFKHEVLIKHAQRIHVPCRQETLLFRTMGLSHFGLACVLLLNVDIGISGMCHIFRTEIRSLSILLFCFGSSDGVGARVGGDTVAANVGGSPVPAVH